MQGLLCWKRRDTRGEDDLLLGRDVRGTISGLMCAVMSVSAAFKMLLQSVVNRELDEVEAKIGWYATI
jgi:hypothetical protein